MKQVFDVETNPHTILSNRHKRPTNCRVLKSEIPLNSQTDEDIMLETDCARQISIWPQKRSHSSAFSDPCVTKIYVHRTFHVNLTTNDSMHVFTIVNKLSYAVTSNARRKYF